MGTKIFSCLFNLLLLALMANGNPAPDGQGGKSVLCNFDVNSAKKTPQERQFFPEDLDLTICTHVMYQRVMVGEELHVELTDDNINLHENETLDLIHRTVALKERKPGLKVILELFDYYGVIEKEKSTDNRESLKTFAKNAVDFIHAQGFDGINYISRKNRQGFMEVIPLLHEELKKKGYILTTFMPPFIPEIGGPYDMTEEFSRNFDLIVIASYWKLPREVTAIFSSIRALESDVDAYTANGVPSEKLVVSIPAFSITLRLCEGEDGGLNSNFCEEEYVEDNEEEEEDDEEQESFLYYYELLQKISNTTEGWVISRDEETGSLYGHSKTRRWASFEDPVSVTAKAALVLKRNLAGIAVITPGMEDFKGAFTENGETFTLTRAAYKALNGGAAVEDTASKTAPSS